MSRPARRAAFIIGFALTLAVVPTPPVFAGEHEDFFEREIRPLLIAKCLDCHGDDAPESGLRLTSRANLLAGGEHGPAAVAGSASESLLIRLVLRSETVKMPPETPLADHEIEQLARWVEIGLPWPEETESTAATPAISEEDRRHWAFVLIGDPSPPAVRDISWPRQPLDQFVLHELEARGLSPSPPVDRRTLLRRVHYTLVGLPPTWQELQEFQNDPRDTDLVLAELVDRLLASTRYGERWGRHWLDVARYADTKDGVLMYGDDRVRPYAYTYRDYVIRAMTEDLPFDRFILEQLSADQLEPPVEPWRLSAMGFLTLGRMYDNNIHDIIDDQIDTVSRGLLGLTVSCARCHDHKYDPIPTADYYALYGVFANSEAPLEPPRTDPAASSPEIEEFEKQAAPKREELRKVLDEQYAHLTIDARARIGDYLVHAATTKPDPLESAIYFLSLAPEDLRPPLVARWRRHLSRHATADDPVFGPWHDLLVAKDEQGSPAAFASRVEAARQSWQTVSDGTQAGQLNPLVRDALIAAELTGPEQVARAYGDLLGRVYRDFEAAIAATGTASGPQVDEARRQLLDLVSGPESPLYFSKSQTRQIMSRKEKDAFDVKLLELDKLAVVSPHAPPRAMSLVDAPEIREPRVFVRGNPTQLGERVPRQFLEILSPAERVPFTKGSGRLELARAIASPTNPLTARVLVNRVWMHHFGEPLVSTPADFGTRSTPPANGPLLDHLAATFIRQGWSVKKLHRMILLSSTWRQASGHSDAAATADPENQLLGRMVRRRLDWESMRDSLLAISGRLEHRAGGQPIKIDISPEARCRTIYSLIDRQSLPGVFRAFDFASPDQTADRRPRTMVPQQALFAMNSEFMAVQAQSLASRPEFSCAAEPDERARLMFREVLLREPSAAEQASLVDFVGSETDPASKLTRWEQLAQILLSASELMYVD